MGIQVFSMRVELWNDILPLGASEGHSGLVLFSSGSINIVQYLNKHSLLHYFTKLELSQLIDENNMQIVMHIFISIHIYKDLQSVLLY